MTDRITIAAITLTAIGILMILLWAIGKSLGIIHSPDWVEMVPIFGAGVTLAGISISIGKMLQKIDRVIFDVEKVTCKTDNLNSRMTVVEAKIDQL